MFNFNEFFTNQMTNSKQFQFEELEQTNIFKAKNKKNNNNRKLGNWSTTLG